MRKSCVPYTTKEKIDDEPSCLVKLDIYKPIPTFLWAASVAPVFKSDESKRICGDYNQTVNKVALCDQYPLSKAGHILATKNGEKKLRIQIYRKLKSS